MQRQDSLDVTNMINAKAALLCARLCLRTGKRYLQEGLFTAAIAALYDAILFAMQYYVAEPTSHGYANISRDDLWDYAALYHKLAKAGVFDDPNAFNHLSLIVERSLWQGSFSFDANSILREVENLLSQLGVMPFNESILHGELVATC